MSAEEIIHRVEHWTDLGVGEGPRGLFKVVSTAGQFKSTVIVQMQLSLIETKWSQALTDNSSHILYENNVSGVFISTENGIICIETPPFDGLYTDDGFSIELPVTMLAEAFAEFDNRMQLWASIPEDQRGKAKTWAELAAMSPWSDPELSAKIAAEAE